MVIGKPFDSTSRLPCGWVSGVSQQWGKFILCLTYTFHEEKGFFWLKKQLASEVSVTMSGPVASLDKRKETPASDTGRGGGISLLAALYGSQYFIEQDKRIELFLDNITELKAYVIGQHTKASR